MAGTERRAGVRFLVFAASLRKDSLNARLAELAARQIEKAGGQVVLVPMAEFDAPSYNQDVQNGPGFPPGAVNLRTRLEASDGFAIASPEYNYSMPGLLKNAIDWISRFKPQPLNGRHGFLLSASPSLVGGQRGLWTLRVPLEGLGAHIFPQMFSLATAHKAIDDRGEIADPESNQRLEKMITAFVDLVEAAKHYPNAKQALAEGTSIRS
jgi:chromate reductase, NAD(P)H dehydrogenase (quinone)